MRSQSIPGLSIVTVVFGEDSDLYRNRQLVSEKLTTLSNHLPLGVAAPNITPLTSSASSVLGIGLTSDKRDLMDLHDIAEYTVKPHLLGATGVADVNIFGGKVRQWQVQFDTDALLRHGVTVAEVIEATRRASGLRPGGFVEGRNQRVIVSADGQIDHIEQLAHATLVVRGGQVLHLRDVATIMEAPAPSISAASVNGKPGVFLMVQGQLGANTFETTLRIEERLAQLEPMLKREGLTVHKDLFRPAGFIETSIGNIERDILIGSALVIAVLFLFLFNARAALISAIAIPLSLLASVIVLVHQGVSLNIMVLGGLVIALGEVVDDAIIDVENIFRRLRENRERGNPRSDWRVVLNASLEVRSSVIYATLIVVLVFMPMLFLSGVAGRMFQPLALTYIYALLASLLVALSVTPALCYLLLNRGIPFRTSDPPIVHWLKQRYERLLRGIEGSAQVVVFSTLITVLLGLAAIPLFRIEFVPELREGHYIVHMTALPGTSETESLRLGEKIIQAIQSVDRVKSVTQWVGRAQNGADTFGMHYSEIEVEIGPLPASEQKYVLETIRKKLTSVEGKPGVAPFPGVTFGINTFLAERIEETVSGFAAELVIEIYGQDLDLLDRDAKVLAQAISTVPGARDVSAQSQPGTPQLEFMLDPKRIAQNNSQRSALHRIHQFRFPLADGGWFSLSDVADIRESNGRSKILHKDGKRVQTITCNISGRDLPSFVNEVKEVITKTGLSHGNYVDIAGDAVALNHARHELLSHAALAMAGVMLLLYLALGNLRNLLITLLNLPFALIGGVMAVMLTSGWLSIGSLVGFITLFGITLRNTIMLVSCYKQLVEVEGLSWGLETAIQGASERLPSILMTAIVTALGLLPLVIGSGEPGREIEGPMACIIVGGLLTSTVLNLLILPALLLRFGRFGKPEYV
ncbi:MAG: efflux RND transporter permease subunit [Betaproteobacteria bacterium]|nr:efflux RND transporter permease subunit [Betaproteobacteria bacterium]